VLGPILFILYTADLVGLVECIPQQALYWQVPGYKRRPGRPRANWRSTINKDGVHLGRSRSGSSCQTSMALECGPNVSSWMRDEPRYQGRMAWFSATSVHRRHPGICFVQTICCQRFPCVPLCLSACVDIVAAWMLANRLQLNTGKTNLL